MAEESKGKYLFGPITDKDVVINIKTPGNTDNEVFIYKEQEIKLSFQKLGLVPDPRILIPLVQDWDVFDDDIFICAYMKCGTHWVWEMCQMLIKGRAEYETKSKESVMVEFHLPEEFNDIQRPRVFNTHFTPICMPRKVIEKKCKIIFLVRNPKDIITSMYHHMINTKINLEEDTSWDQYLQYVFNNDREVSSNWFYYNKKWTEYMAANKDLPILIMRYEDIKSNTIDCLSKLADFIGYPREKELLNEIVDKCNINKMKNVEKERDPGTEVITSHQVSGLYRKGVIGDWKNHFTVAQNEQFESLLEKNMKEDGFKYDY